MGLVLAADVLYAPAAADRLVAFLDGLEEVTEVWLAHTARDATTDSLAAVLERYPADPPTPVAAVKNVALYRLPVLRLRS